MSTPKTFKARLRRILAAHEAWLQRKGLKKVGRALDCAAPGDTVAWGANSRGQVFTIMYRDAEGEARYIAGAFDHVISSLST